MSGMGLDSYIDNAPQVIRCGLKPRVHIGKCSINHRDRTKISKEQRKEIKEAIAKKLLEGKTLCKVIHYELCADGLITEDNNDEKLPCLKRTSVAKYIQEIRISLGINLPLVKVTVIKVYKKMVRLDKSGRRINISSLAREVGCSAEWARKVLKDSNLLASN